MLNAGVIQNPSGKKPLVKIQGEPAPFIATPDSKGRPIPDVGTPVLVRYDPMDQFAQIINPDDFRIEGAEAHELIDDSHTDASECFLNRYFVQ